MSMPVQEVSPTPAKDFFISYNREDSLSAEWTASRLREAGFTTVLQAWDCPPDESFVLDMQKAAKSAWRTLVLLSPSFLASLNPAEWAEFARDSAGRGNKIVLVKVRPCQIEGMLGRMIDVASLDNATAGKALLNGIREGIQPLAGGAAASVKVRITRFDTDITMTEGGAIVLTIDVAAAGVTVFVDLQQQDFVFESDRGAKLDDDHFRFHFPVPGKFKRRLKMFAKVLHNGTVGITCHACGDSLLRESKVILVSEAPLPVKWFHYGVSAIRSHPVITITVALLLATGWGAYRIIVVASDEERRAIVLQAWRFRPTDYFPSGQKRQEWNDSFENKEWTDASWHSRLTEWRPPLIIKNGGFAVTKRDLVDASFYDFDALFMLTLVKGTASWAFRVRPQDPSSDIMRSRGYRFTLSENAGYIRLHGVRCEHLGDMANCVPLWSASSGDSKASCEPNSTFQISARAKDLTFKFAPTIARYAEQPSRDRGQPSCRKAEEMGTFTFRDNSSWPKPFSPFGGVAFLDAQVIQRVQVLQLGELSGTTPSLDK
jgi:hypothetical protein